METNIKVVAAGGETTVRTGQALPLKEPKQISISGDIKTVSNFLNVRKSLGSGLQTIDLSTAVILVDKKALTIQLLADPENFYGLEVLASLEKSEELKQFYINQVKTFTKDELVKLLKFNRLYFESADKHAQMLLAYQKVQSTVNIKANDSSDDRGNKERSFIKEVTSNAPTEFILNIPIFKNFPASKFRVEVCLDVSEGGARFWFESTELHEIMNAQVDDIISKELESAEGFVIIYK